MTKRTLIRVLVGFVGALVLLELMYVAAAKIALRKLPQWASYEALQMTYSAAGSWLPGRVWVRDFVLSGHDSNIQFEVRVKEAQLRIDLLPLLSRHFRATSAITSGVEFRLRHNVEKRQGQERRLAAFPTVRGYDEPPLYPDPPPPQPPADDTWIIEMNDVSARVDDLWLVEYHYAGQGVAKGGFLLDPGRAFHLRPSEFVWQGGALTVGETFVSRNTTGTLRSEMHLDDVPTIEGFDFADKVKIDVDLNLTAGELAFLEVYAGQIPIQSARGRYSARLRLNADRGKVLDGTHVDYEFEDVTIKADGFQVASSGQLQAGAKHHEREPRVDINPLSLALTNTTLTVDKDRSRPFAATVNSGGARVLTAEPSPAFQATMDVRLKPGDALLGPLLGDTPAAITKALLDLPQLTARVAVYLGNQRSRVEVLRLDAGDLAASGVWQDRPRGGSGDFSIKTDLVDIGVALSGGRVSWDLE